MNIPSKKYARLGLRRDKNLSDVADPISALNNLLNNLVNDNTKTFISEDLDAIRGLKNTDITPTKLYDLANTKVQYSALSTSSGSIQEYVVTPIVTLKDRIDNSKIVTGNIPAISGGMGLLARFIQSSDINTGSTSSTGATIFNLSNAQKQEVFWELGEFSFSNYIDNSFGNQYGGIQWTGYFSPRPRDPNPSIIFDTTGLIIFESDPNEDDNWKVLRSFYAASRTLDIISGSTTNIITVASGQGKFVGIGDAVDTTTNLVTSVDNDIVTLDLPYTGSTITLSKEIGKTSTSGSITLPPVDIGKQIKIRISYWYPDNGVDVPEKNIQFDYTGSQLPFYQLYENKPSQVLTQYEIRQFLQDAVTPYQSNVGVAGSNKHLFVNASLISEYSPKSSLAQITKAGPIAISCTSTNNLISSETDLSGVEIGNIIVPAVSRSSTLITNTIQVKDTLNNYIKVLTSNIGNTSTDTVNFIDHRGFIGWYYATSSGSTVTLPNKNTSELRSGFVVITPSSTPTDYKQITSLNNNTFVTDSALNLSGEEIIYVYSDRSLIDTSKDFYCAGVFGQVLAAPAVAGDTQIVMTSVTGVVPGQVIQYDGAIPNSTVITGIIGNTVNLSNALTSTIKVSSTIVFAPAGTSVNKEACVIPLDTAPPFIGTTIGLSSGGNGIRGISANATFDVIVNVLAATTEVQAATPSTFDKTVTIKSGGSTYSILGTKF